MWQHGYICGLLLCSFGLLAQTRFEQADPTIYPRSAEIGKVGFVVYEVIQREDPSDHICFPNEYNCTTPHGQCSDNHDKYELVVVADPVTEDDGHKWYCGIQIEDVSFNDVGVYKICKLVGGAQTVHGCVEHQGLDINFAAWEIDSHGRTCQTSYDETSKELVNNCTSLTTTPQLTTTGIFSVREILTAWVGDNVNIPFGYCSLPRPSCTLTQSFKLSSPNPTCKVDHYEHCAIARAPDNDPLRDGMDSVCELCVLVVHGVTESDAGPYAICQTSSSGSCSFWRKILTLKVEDPSTPTNSTSTKVSTKPTTEATKTTKPADAPKNVSEITSLRGTKTPTDNKSRTGMSTSSAIGIPFNIVLLVILFIVGAVYFWKRRNRRQNTPLSPESPYADTTTGPITEGSPVVFNIQIANEVTRLRAESESDT